VCIGKINFERNDLRFFVCWFYLTLSRSCSKVKVINQSSRTQEETVAKVVGATSSEGFLVVKLVSLDEGLVRVPVALVLVVVFSVVVHKRCTSRIFFYEILVKHLSFFPLKTKSHCRYPFRVGQYSQQCRIV